MNNSKIIYGMRTNPQWGSFILATVDIHTYTVFVLSFKNSFMISLKAVAKESKSSLGTLCPTPKDGSLFWELAGIFGREWKFNKNYSRAFSYSWSFHAQRAGLLPCRYGRGKEVTTAVPVHRGSTCAVHVLIWGARGYSKYVLKVNIN